MTSRTRLLVLLISAPVIAFAVIGGLLGNVLAREETYQPLRVFLDVISLVTSNYVEPVDVDKVMRGAMRGLAEGLDPDSAYLTAEQVRQYQKGDLAAGEVGMDLTRQYYLRVIAVRDKSPAAKAGLQPGDFIRAIDGKPTREMSVFEGDHLIHGAPGSKVTLTVIRSSAAEPHEVSLVREVIPAPQVSGRIAAPGIGYVRIPAFTSSTPQQLRSTIADLERAGAKRLAIDVRSCAAGPFEAAIAAARLFVPSGTLAVRERRGAQKEPVMSANGDGAVSLPAVVLIDMGSSGPAEVFAAALEENKRADLVGEHTHGRVVALQLSLLSDGSGILVPHSWYLGPNGGVIQDKGLSPDTTVEVPEVDFGAAAPTTDLILEKALERLSAKAGAGA
jgi:carboxyl-terminal processing protease